MTRPFVQSYEAWIESKAGACPPDVDEAVFVETMHELAIDWPFSSDAPTTPPDDEGLAEPPVWRGGVGGDA